MSETFKIIQTCSCGAKLEFTETVSEPYFRRGGKVQAAFQEAHAKCIQTPKEPKQ